MRTLNPRAQSTVVFNIFGNSEDAHTSPHRVSEDTVVNDFGRYILSECLY